MNILYFDTSLVTVKAHVDSGAGARTTKNKQKQEYVWQVQLMSQSK